MDDRDLGVIVAVATVIRINFETHGVVAAGLFQDEALPSVEALGIYQMKINRIVRQFNKMRRPSDAAGAMVWSYSLRCLNVPELRPLGREMWAQLSRGLPHVEEALKDGEEQKGEPLFRQVWDEWSMIPVGLEPE